ncbi:MAG TPA: DUF3417 domain-containing protein, partial [Acidimicrobiales bacterium]|nr:DUF3417 domain-containing protein [Acidimicrobiales bacterium]
MHRADYDDLVAVAADLRWTWKLDARRLFARLDPSASRGAREWPHQVLAGLGRDLVEERLMVDDDLSALADRVVADFRTNRRTVSRSWFATHHRDARDLL